ncbi:MAG: hypothetical protein KF784_17370 [Fimbriimonadaceae bacterium]|nr:hypothetical protein [Fimbriimonadaceae bacterium]MBX3649316.1 hypothetical protein [Rhodocyclaceae bacterium]MCW5929994.1 hypothetical protein [Chitinophagaceae bacterium]
MFEKTVLVAVLALSAGCTYQGMIYAEHTHVGTQIKIAPQADVKPVDVNLGYDRGIIAVVPRTAPGENAGSAISKTDLDIRFAYESRIKNVFATGVAAKNLARDGANVAALFGQCVDESQGLKDKKAKAKAKLSEYSKKDDDASRKKLEGLYGIAFPRREIHVWTTKADMLRALGDRLAGICDSQSDVELAGKYESEL